jgi:hypothetical protein
MPIVIVGQKNGKAVIRWPQCLGLCLVLSVVLGLGVGLTFYLPAGYWSHKAVLFGIVIAVGIWGDQWPENAA